ELRGVVVARAGLQPLPADAPVVGDEHAGVVAGIDGIRNQAVELVVEMVDARGEQMAGAQLQVALERSAVAAGDEDAAEFLALVVVGTILAASQGRSEFQSRALPRMPQLQRADLLPPP